MRRSVVLLSWLAPVVLMAAPTHAASVIDATGDFLPTFVGPNLADLDVTSFSVNFNSVGNFFTLGATFAGAINPATAGFYVFGVNTGTGTARPFAAIGQPNVIFNQAIIVRKDGTGSIGATALDPANILIAGNILAFRISAALLPSTGFVAGQYGFNLWPRTGLGNNNQISDFAPENATLAAATVPDAPTWVMLIAGFGLIGALARSRRYNFPVALA